MTASSSNSIDLRFRSSSETLEEDLTSVLGAPAMPLSSPESTDSSSFSPGPLPIPNQLRLFDPLLTLAVRPTLNPSPSAFSLVFSRSREEGTTLDTNLLFNPFVLLEMDWSQDRSFSARAWDEGGGRLGSRIVGGRGRRKKSMGADGEGRSRGGGFSRCSSQRGEGC